MASISKQAIKRLVKRHFKAVITDDAASELASIIEREATRISKFAVENAKKSKREKVTKEDIYKYMVGKSR